MGLMILSVVCSFAAYIVGTAMEMIPGVNLPGLGITLAVLAMGPLSCSG